MSLDLVSIVIPVYNVEKYVDKCIESVVAQSYRVLEIILVDDGSSDTSPSICDAWKEKDSRIRVIHKKNEGLGMARNSGIETATGKYICFFDSDDYIENTAIEIIYKKIIEDNSEIVVFGYTSVNRDGTVNFDRVPCTPKSCYENDEVQELFVPHMIAPDLHKNEDWGLQMSACMTMISVDLIKNNNFSFISEKKNISEDVYSLINLYKNVKKVSVVKKALYYYVNNPLSLTRTFRKDRYVRIKQFYLDTCELCDVCGYNPSVKERLIQPYISFTITAVKQICFSDLKCYNKLELIREIVNDKEFISGCAYMLSNNPPISRFIFYKIVKTKNPKVVLFSISLLQRLSRMIKK